MRYFLIVYNRSTGVSQVSEFSEAERREALQRRFVVESDLQGLPEYEIVVLGGADLEQIKQTHGRYFKNVSELAAG